MGGWCTHSQLTGPVIASSLLSLSSACFLHPAPHNTTTPHSAIVPCLVVAVRSPSLYQRNQLPGHVISGEPGSQSGAKKEQEAAHDRQPFGARSQ